MNASNLLKLTFIFGLSGLLLGSCKKNDVQPLSPQQDICNSVNCVPIEITSISSLNSEKTIFRYDSIGRLAEKSIYNPVNLSHEIDYLYDSNMVISHYTRYKPSGEISYTFSTEITLNAKGHVVLEKEWGTFYNDQTNYYYTGEGRLFLKQVSGGGIDRSSDSYSYFNGNYLWSAHGYNSNGTYNIYYYDYDSTSTCRTKFAGFDYGLPTKNFITRKYSIYNGVEYTVERNIYDLTADGLLIRKITITQMDSIVTTYTYTCN